jgi:hypothetical protein
VVPGTWRVVPGTFKSPDGWVVPGTFKSPDGWVVPGTFKSPDGLLLLLSVITKVIRIIYSNIFV